jgi:hypothetical protein
MIGSPAIFWSEEMGLGLAFWNLKDEGEGKLMATVIGDPYFFVSNAV